jgi:UDP-glucose 4-epimerase/UDP-arabinose 4-epimerase
MTDRGTVLVTGGAGYIGAHCCKALSEAGYLPVCFDNLSTGHADFVRCGPLVKGDLGEAGAIAAAFTEHRPIAVMHFAAASLVGESVSDPQKYYLNNVAGTLSLLRAMREAGCNRLVFSSTGAVYGNAGSEPIREDAVKSPVNPYGASKLMIERMLDDFRIAYRLNSVSLRYFNASGADAMGAIGERREVETHLIPRAMMALQGHVTDFAIFGDDYATPDGTAIRDYIHVTDLAVAHLRALERLNEGNAGGVYNLGTGSGHSVRAVLGAIEAATGRRVATTMRPRRPGDPAVLVADPSAAGAALGFTAVRSDLGSIVRSAWTWHQQAHPSRARA